MRIAIAVTLLMFVAAASFVVAGVYMLVGMAWSFIALGLFLFGAGVFLRSGLNANG